MNKAIVFKIVVLHTQDHSPHCCLKISAEYNIFVAKAKYYSKSNSAPRNFKLVKPLHFRLLHYNANS